MVVDHLNAVNLAAYELLFYLAGYINTLLHVRLFGKTGEVASHMKPHFSRLLSNFASYRVDNDVVLAPQTLRILVNNVLEQTDDIGIESATQTAVRRVNHQGDTLHRALHVEHGRSVGL